MPNAQDLAFVQEATASGLAEVTEGQIAIAKSLITRDFGQRMVTDHTAANKQLSAIAAQEHIPQSPVLTGPAQQDIVTLDSSLIRTSPGPMSRCKSSIIYRRLGSSFRKPRRGKVRRL
jgi:hypothetical protein